MSNKTVTLTAETILKRSKVSSLNEVQHFSYWGYELENVSIIEQCPNIVTISFAVNNIKTLKPFSNCKKLVTLNLRRNNIKNLNELYYLRGLSFLQELNLDVNPMAAKKDYRLFCIALLTQLTSLDAVDIKANEKELAIKMFPKPEDAYQPPDDMPIMNSNKIINGQNKKASTISSDESTSEEKSDKSLKAKFVEVEKQLAKERKQKEEEKKRYEKILIEKDSKISHLKEENARLLNENENLQKMMEKVNQKAEISKPKSLDLEIFDCQTIDDLHVVQTIGRGSQSEVFEVTRDQHLALKVLLISGGKKDTNPEIFKKLQRLLQEYEILHLLNHRNIIRTYGFCCGDEKHAPSILLEYCPKNLNEAIGSMNDTEKVCCVVEICLGMEAVHAENLIHRDLKPENILLDEKGHVKVSDFGISCYVDVENQTQSKTAGVGTLKFMAPELLKESTHYDNKVDVYSFGVVLFFILTEKLPKISVIDQGNGKKAVIPKNINKISRELINRCWSTDSCDRPSFTEIIEFIKKDKFKLIDGVEKDINDIISFLSI